MMPSPIAMIRRMEPGAVRLDSSCAMLKAQEYQNAVRAQGLIAEAEAQAAAIALQAQEAYRQACEQGRREGLDAAAREAAARHFEFVRAAIAHLAGLQDAIAAMVKEAIFKLAGEMDIDDVTRRIVQKALRRYRSLPDLKLRVAPDQEEMLRAHLDRMALGGSGPHLIRVEVDSGMRKGDCILESSLGVVDIGLENQVSVLAAVMEQACASGIPVRGAQCDSAIR